MQGGGAWVSQNCWTVCADTRDQDSVFKIVGMRCSSLIITRCLAFYRLHIAPEAGALLTHAGPPALAHVSGKHTVVGQTLVISGPMLRESLVLILNSKFNFQRIHFCNTPPKDHFLVYGTVRDPELFARCSIV